MSAVQIERTEVGRLLRFLTVGMGGTVIDFTVLALLKLMEWPTLLANTIAFSGGVTNNYIWNRNWTFADRKGGVWWRQFGQFLLVSLIGLCLNSVIVWGLEDVFANVITDSIAYIPAKLIATGCVVFWNFFANRYWTFL